MLHDIPPVYLVLSQETVQHVVTNLEPFAGRRSPKMRHILEPKNGKSSKLTSFSDVFTFALCLVLRVGILPVNFMALIALVMACIALSEFFWKKDSISDKKFLFLLFDMVDLFLCLSLQNY